MKEQWQHGQGQQDLQLESMQGSPHHKPTDACQTPCLRGGSSQLGPGYVGFNHGDRFRPLTGVVPLPNGLNGL